MRTQSRHLRFTNAPKGGESIKQTPSLLLLRPLKLEEGSLEVSMKRARTAHETILLIRY